MSYEEKPRLVAENIKPNMPIQRRPYGRACRVVQVNAERTKVKIRDGSSVVWVNMATILKDWA